MGVSRLEIRRGSLLGKYKTGTLAWWRENVHSIYETSRLVIDSRVMANQTSDIDLRRYAVLGAEARLLQIAEEAAAIYRVFPQLRDRARVATNSAADGQSAASESGNGATARKGTRRRRRMSAAQRKAVGDRMRKLWAARRGETASAKLASTEGRSGKARRGGARRMSAAARKRISEAQKARWAKIRKAAAR